MKRIEWKLDKARAAMSKVIGRVKRVVPFIVTFTVSFVVMVLALAWLSAGLNEVLVYFEHSQIEVQPPRPATVAQPPSRPQQKLVKIPAYEFASQAVFKVLSANGERKFLASGGTGFLVKLPKSGRVVVMTNKHVCNGVDRESKNDALLVQGNKVYYAKIETRSRLTDICILTAPSSLLESGEHTPYAIAEAPAKHYTEGNVLFVYGHPRLMPLAMITAVFVNYTKDYFDTDLPTTRGFGRFFGEIHPGNSGSPLLTANNEVVGVVFAYERLPDQPPAGLFIPIQHAIDAATDNE